ncbi:MAG: DNA replication/repair protein RecF [Anaerococcus prevotii]|uniref:DNA replication/repair protein RecF n=1 Tax=Anaerococcus prevotii TaxID=33034 RepID=UPI0028FFACF5|nr:DNA replication/repair protein RecF [Anaerococcus prevotii]MDU2558985.1 DNA replication/repair protein RecF [Anaerococcus prevotii]
MRIKDLRLNNFRNYFYENVEFNKDSNIFIGDNAQGKTNLLESVYYLANASSFKKIRDKDIIRFSQSQMKLAGTIRKGRSFKEVFIEVKDNDKSIFVNGVKYDRRKDLRSLFKIVLFTPEDLGIIKDGPNRRRDLIDEIIEEIDLSYKANKRDYDKILYQRNKLLKKQNAPYFKEQLEAFDKSLTKLSYKIYKTRSKFIKIIDKFASEFQSSLTANKEELKLSYKADIEASTLTEYEEIFRSARDLDFKYLTSQRGIHRDEIEISINGKNTKSFASQGQQRSAILNIRLAEVRLIKEVTGDEAVILFDDVFSELDEKRSMFLLENLKGFQTIITATNTKSLEYVDREKISYILDGKIRKE